MMGRSEGEEVYNRTTRPNSQNGEQDGVRDHPIEDGEPLERASAQV